MDGVRDSLNFLLESLPHSLIQARLKTSYWTLRNWAKGKSEPKYSKGIEIMRWVEEIHSRGNDTTTPKEENTA